jgi:glycosyltransferase involved in cell wall biosynthesis
MRKTSNQTPFISVVLPVYNGKDTIRLCIDSMLAQDFKDFELIIVNDGSKDNSLEILNKEYAKFFNVKIYSKANGGESSARNYGVDRAEGKWITFIDQDDFVDSNYLSSFMQKEELREDTFYVVGEKEGFSIDSLKPQYNIYASGETNETMLQLLSNNGTTWGKLFLRERLIENNIRYNENVFYGGDKLFTMQYAAFINRVIYNEKAFPYNYVNNFNPSKFMKDFNKEMTNFLEIEINLKKSFSSRFQYQWLVVHLKLLVLSIYARYHKSKERKEKLEIVKNHIYENEDFVKTIEKQNWKSKIIFNALSNKSCFLIDRFLALFIPMIVWTFANKRIPFFIKRLLKSFA